MVKRFELHLGGMNAPEGLIDADRLIDIVKALQAVAIGLGRIATESQARGRPSRNLDRVAGLRIGLEKGSTTIIAERDLAQTALDVDLPDEEEVDLRFAELIEGIGADIRPAWVTDSVARKAGDLVGALQRAAPRVEFKVGGVSTSRFQTRAIHRETWGSAHPPVRGGTIAFTGRLFAVNLNTHRLQVQDDAGYQIGLPNVLNDTEVGKLVGLYVTVSGAPEVDVSGKLTRIANASVSLAADPLDGKQIRPGTPLEEILNGAPGPTPGGLAGLTDAEIDAFAKALG